MMIDADKATIQDQDRRPDKSHITRKIMITTDSAPLRVTRAPRRPSPKGMEITESVSKYK